MDIGTKIQFLREERNWSQKDLAAALDESSQSISKWEAGTSLPELDRLIHISMIFEIPLEELMGDQAGEYDLQTEKNPSLEAQKRKKEKILLLVKLFGISMVIFLLLVINIVWFRFLFRLIS